MANYRYGAYDDGPDPLAAPYDVREALDEMGERILGGDNPRDALRDLLRRGWQDRRGLDDLMRRVRERQRELRNAGRLDGMLDQARELLDEALEAERGALFPDPSDDARLQEAELDALPTDTSRAIRQLSEYDWRSPQARQKFEELRDLLRREVLDSQFKGMKQALENPDPAAMQRVKDMLADLRQMLDADTRGEHTQQDFDDFMGQYGDMFPDNPTNLEELVDSLVRRMQAAERLLNSLSDEQREELANLMSQAMEDAGLAAELSALGDAPGGPNSASRSAASGCRAASRSVSATPRARSPTWRTSLTWSRRSARSTRAPAWRTSMRKRSAARSAGRRSTTCRRCADWSGNYSSRAT
jgi:uncharacterized protein with von Willebrand factor type A (vWA) domain